CVLVREFVLGLLRRDHQRRLHAEGARHRERFGQGIPQPARPGGRAGAGHLYLPDLRLRILPPPRPGRSRASAWSLNLAQAISYLSFCRLWQLWHTGIGAGMNISPQALLKRTPILPLAIAV